MSVLLLSITNQDVQDSYFSVAECGPQFGADWSIDRCDSFQTERERQCADVSELPPSIRSCHSVLF